MNEQAGKRAVAIIMFAVLSTSLVTGSYLLMKRFLDDRQSAMNLPAERTANERRRAERNATTRPETQASTRAANPSAPTAVNAGEAAIQRQLRTLEEINKINEMNRRLQEQQQRMQNQR